MQADDKLDQRQVSLWWCDDFLMMMNVPKIERTWHEVDNFLELELKNEGEEEPNLDPKTKQRKNSWTFGL